MNDKDTGGPAFPNPRWEGWGSPEEGMTLRDYFAAKALQGLLFEGLGPEQTAQEAYKVADAMLEARKQ